MAASVSITLGPEVPGSRKEVYGTVTFDSSYPTGGEAVSLADLGLSRLDWLSVEGTDGHVPAWNGSATAPKIKLFVADYDDTGKSPLAEVTNGGNTTGVVARFRAVGA